MIPLLRRHRLFVLLVMFPSLCATIYFGLIASDIFISESRFVVRSPQHPVQSGLIGQLLQTSGFSRAQDDTYSVHDYILSRDALKELDQKLAVQKSYSRNTVDTFVPDGGLDWDRSFEEFYRYYGKHVGVEYDPVSSISVLSVRAFTANDAFRINSMLIDMSEGLVNTLNDRSRQDL